MSTIIIKNSGTPGNQPASLAQGELAINTVDGKIFYGSGAGVSEFTPPVDTSSLATTGSNTFKGDQTISGSALISGSVVITQDITASNAYITSASIDYLYVNLFESASTIYSSGSNQFGDAPNDTQTLYGSVIIPTGSLTVTGSVNITGSTTQTGNNTLTGNTVLSGSIGISGSSIIRGTTTMTGSLNITGSTTQIGSNSLYGNTSLSGSIVISGSTTTPSVQIYGNTTHNGYIRFDPVSTNIDQSISASYIYVSGSTNDLYFTQNGNGYNNTTRLRWLEGNLYTGLLYGGLISASVGGTTFNVSSGSGIIVTLNASVTQEPYPIIKYVNWGNFTGQTINNISTAIQTYIGIDSNGAIIQQTTPWTDGQYNESISLGTVIHQNLSTVNATITYPNVAYGYKQRTYDFIKAFGPLKLSGYELSTSSSLGLTVGSGSAFADGRNYQTDPNNPSYILDNGTAVSKIFRYYQSGSSFVQDTNAAAGYPGIDTTQYNPGGSGSLSSTSGGKYYAQRVFWYPNSATKGIVVYYGLGEYNSLDEAQANYQQEPFLETPNTQQNAVFLGIILIRGNADFTNPTNYRILRSSLFRAAGTGGGGGTGGGATTLSALTDVQLGTLEDKQSLVYDSGSAKWVNTYTLSGSLEGTASWATNAITASYAQTLTLQSTLTTFTSSVTTAGINTLFTQATSSYNSAFGKYTVLSGSNARAGEFMAVWNSGSVTYTDTATTDIGSTTNITFSSSFSGANILLQATASAGWTVKMLTTFI